MKSTAHRGVETSQYQHLDASLETWMGRQLSRVAHLTSYRLRKHRESVTKLTEQNAVEIFEMHGPTQASRPASMWRMTKDGVS